MSDKPKMTQATQICAVDYAFKRIGGKYKARILWELHKSKVLRYGELSRSLHDISGKMLTQALRELENDKLITRNMYHEVPPKVEYSLSVTGQELTPFITHLYHWAKKQIAAESALS